MCFWKKKKKAEAPKVDAAPKAEAKPAEEVKEDKTEREYSVKTYHVSKRAKDNKWVITFAGGEKVIKCFDTKAEAMKYADTLAGNQEGVIMTHASKGKKQGKINQKVNPKKKPAAK